MDVSAAMTHRVIVGIIVALCIGLSLCLSFFLGFATGRFTEARPVESPSLESAGIIYAAELAQPPQVPPLSRGFAPPEIRGLWPADVAYRHEIEDGLEQYPNVERAARDSGFDPLTFISAIIQIESGGNPQAVNPKSQAAGLMQVTPHTSRVPMEELLTPGVGIAEGVRALDSKLASNDGDLYEAMFDFSGGPLQMFQGQVVGWSGKKAFEEAYWQRLLSVYESIAGMRTTRERIPEFAELVPAPAEEAWPPGWTERLTRLATIAAVEPAKSLEVFLSEGVRPGELGVGGRQDDTSHRRPLDRLDETPGSREFRDASRHSLYGGTEGTLRESRRIIVWTSTDEKQLTAEWLRGEP